MRTIALKVPDRLDAKIAKIARRRRLTKAALVREALESLHDDEGEEPKVSCLDLVIDLVGALEGPNDLSTNKRYLEGLGQ